MNKKEEYRDGYLVTSLMKEVWSIQLDMLKILMDVCNRHGLKIWAEGGTLLGAIRHKGYIPWDDDIDMMMMRSDYDKLLSVASEEFKEPLFLQTASSEPGFFRGHAQLRMSGTTAILPNDIWQNFHQGIFIDIFVFDFLPKENHRISIFAKLEKMRGNMYYRNYGSLLSRNPLKHYCSKNIIAKAGGLKKYYDNMTAMIIDCDSKSSTQVGDVLWTSYNYQKYMREIEWYEHTQYMPFEDISIPVPSDYDSVLRRQYGDYLKPVKAPSQHGNVIFDTERSYTEVLKELRKKASIKQKLKHFFSFDAAID